MKKIILALAFLVGSVAGAAAACTSPAVMHDFPGTSFNMSLATNAGDGNCSSNVTVVGTVPLPTGSSTSANQTSELTKLDTLHTDLGTLNTTAGSAVPAGTSRIGYTSDDPCNNASTKVYTPINVVTATNVIIAGVSAKKKYICSIFLYPAGTDNVAIYQATTGTSCATALVAILGGTTTTTGFQMTAQAGFVVGNGVSSVAATTVVNTDICVTTSAAVQLSGVVVTADQ